MRIGEIEFGFKFKFILELIFANFDQNMIYGKSSHKILAQMKLCKSRGRAVLQNER